MKRILLSLLALFFLNPAFALSGYRFGRCQKGTPSLGLHSFAYFAAFYDRNRRHCCPWAL